MSTIPTPEPGSDNSDDPKTDLTVAHIQERLQAIGARGIHGLLDQVLQRDRFRLRAQYQRLQPLLQNASALADQDRSVDAKSIQDWQRAGAWLQQFEASHSQWQDRARSIPALKYDPELPITARREEIIRTIQERQVLVLCGETGSGKSTQLPKILLDAGFGVRGMIGHTQPRRLAARAVSMRLAEELGTRVGEKVGFKIRFTDKTAPTTLVKLMTDGVLLAETQSDRFLDQYEAIIIDEAHERSLNIDFLLAYLRGLLSRRKDLKLIITSATIDPERFAQHFADDLGPAPIIEVQGRTYPVEVRYRSSDELIDDLDGPVPVSPTDGTPLTAMAQAIDEVCAAGPGDVLVFLPTERDIRLAAKYLRGWFTAQGQHTSVDILPLYARLSEAEQNRIFQTHSQRRIVLATNVAESSLTVPGIHFVIDTGVARISRYAPRQRVQRLPVEAISQASADQRAGRCGRLGPGICIRLYSPEDYATRTRFTTPEIRRSDLAAVVLQCAMLRLGNLLELPLLDPPTPEAVRDGERTLREIGALDDKHRLTEIGRQLGKLPCDPRVGRMLLAAHERNVLNDVLVIAAGLESQDPRLRPPGHQPQADEAQWEFRDPQSDFLGLLRLWHFYEHLRSTLSRSRLGKALEQRFLSLQRFREWSDVVRQLKEMLAGAGFKVGAPHINLPPIERVAANKEEEDQSGHQQRKNDRQRANQKPLARIQSRPDGYDAIHQSLLTGLLSSIATRGDQGQYLGTHSSSFSIWPGSGLFQRPPKWLMAAEVLETSKRYGRTLAEIDVAWIEKLAGPLLKHSYSDPYWSSKTQTAMVYQRSTLYGLPVMDRRPTALAPIDPDMARQMLIAHGLVQGECQCREKFWLHNQKVLADLQELAERSRRRDLLVDPYRLEQFYEERLPSQVIDMPSLRKWIAAHNGSPEEKSLWLKPEDVLATAVHAPAEHDYPKQLQIGPTQLPLSYRFHPGDPEDGITVTIPQAALRQVSDEALGWLVPGLIEDKLLHLIRSLPKNLRTNFVPAPDVARKLAGSLMSIPRNTPFSTAVARVLSDYSGETIKPQDFDWQKLPEYLRFHVRVIDDHGKVIDSGRDLEKLQQDLSASASPIVADHASAEVPAAWNGRKVTALDIEKLPDSITIMRGGVKVAAYPAIVDQRDGVSMRLMDNSIDAHRTTQQGWVRLYSLRFRKELQSQVAHLPKLESSGVLLSKLVKPSLLKEQLRDLIARIAFIESQPTLRSADDYQVRALDAVKRISVATQEIAPWLPQLAENYQAIRLALESAPAPWHEVRDDIQGQLKELFEDEFLARVAWDDLKQYPRYLQAARMRWDKLRSGGVPKDRKLREPVDKLHSRLVEQLSQATDPIVVEHLKYVRILIEELRVSVFAQQLGTRESVSVKRIDELLAEAKG